MGVFLTTSAIKSKSASAVAIAVIEYLSDHGVVYNKLDVDDFPRGQEVAVYQSNSEWVVILWPSYFALNEVATINYLSSELDTLVSSVSIYDGDSWSHTLYQSGEELDTYNSGFWMAIQSYPSFSLKSWNTDLELLSDKFEVDEPEIACFFQGNPPVKQGSPESKCSVHPESAGTPWIFTDFWNSVGINYPIPDISPYEVYRLEPGYEKKLP